MTANKGTVLTVGEGANLNMVRVAPIDNIDAVSTFYKIPKYLQDEDIKQGDQVAFLSFADGTGVILAKM